MFKAAHCDTRLQMIRPHTVLLCTFELREGLSEGSLKELGPTKFARSRQFAWTRAGRAFAQSGAGRPISDDQWLRHLAHVRMCKASPAIIATLSNCALIWLLILSRPSAWWASHFCEDTQIFYFAFETQSPRWIQDGMAKAVKRI